MKYMPVAAVLLLVPTFAFASVADKKALKKADKALADGMKIGDDNKPATACGKNFKTSFHWASFEKIDFAVLEKDKKIDIIPFLPGSLSNLGAGVNNVCKDAEYKEAMSKIKEIVVKGSPENDPADRVVAAHDKDVLTIVIKLNGSTVSSDEYLEALKKGL